MRINKIVEQFRKSGIEISNEEVAEVVKLCERKIELTHQKPDCIEVLLLEELRNYCFRQAVNATTLFRQLEKECIECAAYV